MKIVDTATFLANPVGTVFAKCDYGRKREVDFASGLAIKGQSTGRTFWYQPISEIGIIDSGEGDVFDGIVRQLDAGMKGASITLDFDVQSKDGLYDEGQMYFIFERQDVEALIARLQLALTGAE